MDLGLNAAAVIVTGASRGIGFAIARAFSQEGARVAICGRSDPSLQAAAKEIRAAGGECLPIVTDLTQSGACESFVNSAAERFGRLDVLVNNAALNVDKPVLPIENTTDDDLYARFNAKTMPAIRCSRAALAHMRRSGGGKIVMIGGAAALAVNRKPDRFIPSANAPMVQGLGNAALTNFTKYLSEEAAKDQILVNIVHPHITRTDRHKSRIAARARDLGVSEAAAEESLARTIPIGRVVEATDVASLVLFLGSRLSSAITGQSIAVDGGALQQVRY